MRRLVGCVLALALSGAAVAAPSAACDRARTSLENLDLLSGGELNVRFADSMIGPELPRGGDELRGSKTPYLFLTPRVASILENIFGDDDAAAASPAPEDDAAEETATSPVAENTLAAPAEGDAPAAEHGDTLPNFQRQMYRTDI